MKSFYITGQAGQWVKETILLIIYKTLFEFAYLKRYMYLFSYAYTGTIRYQISYEKWIISSALFFVFLIILFRNEETKNYIYDYLIRFIYTICVVPMLSVYAFFTGFNFGDIMYPTVFWLLFILVIRRNQYREKKNDDKQFFEMPKILHINNILLVVFISIAVLIWVWRGMPFFLNLSESLAQRLELRASAMPTIIGYIFTFLGGTIFPYLFSKYLDERRVILAAMCFISGILLFFINGMKTWLFLYMFYFFVYIVIKIGRNSQKKTNLAIEIMMILLLVGIIVSYDTFGIIDFVSQYARVVIIPSEIGYRSIDFFNDPNNPFLFLRESVLRGLFSTPYANGSDFFIIHGNNVTTSSSRANNGLWGDAYKNFGFLGVIIYPYLIAYIFMIVERNGRHMKTSLRLFVLFMILWGSINTSFFTWLLTGGVLVIILLEKIDKANQNYYSTNELTAK